MARAARMETGKGIGLLPRQTTFAGPITRFAALRRISYCSVVVPATIVARMLLRGSRR